MVSKMGLDVTPSELKDATNTQLSLDSIETVIEIQEEMGDKVLSPTEIKVFNETSLFDLASQQFLHWFLESLGCRACIQSYR